MGGAAAARKPSMDEDDESEAFRAMDEDVGNDRVRCGSDGGIGRGKGGSGREGGRARKEDDGAWDGLEPDCWKRVNEPELARRVRDMRESRTAPPVTEKLEWIWRWQERGSYQSAIISSWHGMY